MKKGNKIIKVVDHFGVYFDVYVSCAIVFLVVYGSILLALSR